MKIKIIVIGCGGTGGYFVPLLGQYISRWLKDYDIYVDLYDSDIVEKKNLDRQLFGLYDLGEKKSFCMAYKLELFTQQPEKINFYDSVTSYTTFDTNGFDKVFVVVSVDNMNARRVIMDVVKKTNHKYIVVIDAGVKEFHGQVFVGYKQTGKKGKILEEYEEFLKIEEPEEENYSCAVRVDQTPVINIIAGMNLLIELAKVIEGEDESLRVRYFTFSNP